MTAKVENHCAAMRTKTVCIESNARACVNCIWYEQYFRQGRGSIRNWVPTSKGFCLLREEARGALRQPCRQFEPEQTKK